MILWRDKNGICFPRQSNIQSAHKNTHLIETSCSTHFFMTHAWLRRFLIKKLNSSISFSEYSTEQPKLKEEKNSISPA